MEREVLSTKEFYEQLKKKIEFNDTDFKEPLNFGKDRSLIPDLILFTNCTFKSFEINLDSTLQISFDSCYAEDLIFKNIRGDINIFGNSEIDNLSIENCNQCNIVVTGSPLLKDKKQAYIKFFNIGVINQCRLDILCKCESFIFQPIHFISDNNSKIEILETKNLILSGHHKENSIFNLTAFVSQKILIHDYRCFGNTTMSLNGGFSRMSIENSKLNLHFTRINLKNCDHLTIGNSDLTNTQFGTIAWPSKLLQLFKSSSHLGARIQTARYLKIICTNNNEEIYARLFRLFELDFYYQNLLTDKWSNFWEIAPLAISKWTNKFGRGWEYALIWLISSSSILFFLCSMFYHQFRWPEFGNEFLTGHFFDFILPIHKLSSIFPNYEYHSIYWPTITSLDFVQRILSSFLIYQLIRSFRFHFTK